MKPIPIAQYLAQARRVELTEPQALRRDNVLLKPRVVPLSENVEARVEEAFERGRKQGLVDGQTAAAEEAACKEAERELRAITEQVAFRANHYAQLADKITAGLVEIEERVAATVARILKPYLTQEHLKQVAEALSDNLTRILSADAPSLLKISGPDEELHVLREKLSTHPVVVEYSVEEGVDVTVEAQQTIIKSQLQTWIDLLASIGE